MRFAPKEKFGVKAWRHVWQVQTICRVMQVTTRGFRKWLTRPISKRQRSDMKVLAHIREQYGLSLGSAVYPERPPCGQSKGKAPYDYGAQGSGP